MLDDPRFAGGYTKVNASCGRPRQRQLAEAANREIDRRRRACARSRPATPNRTLLNREIGSPSNEQQACARPASTPGRLKCSPLSPWRTSPKLHSPARPTTRRTAAPSSVSAPIVPSMGDIGEAEPAPEQAFKWSGPVRCADRCARSRCVACHSGRSGAHMTAPSGSSAFAGTTFSAVGLSAGDIDQEHPVSTLYVVSLDHNLSAVG